MKVFHCDHFTYPLPPDHRFPASKYRLLRERVGRELAARCELVVPAAATDAELLLAHDREYLDKVVGGALSQKEVRRIGLPWSPELVERSRRSVGSTIGACRAALSEGLAVSLTGGTHHAYADHGEGFCVFNDCAVAARAMQREGRARRVVIVDCDVHQGNGTAAILAVDRTIYTFSMHGAKNFPLHKEQSDLDVELPDAADDRMYLDLLAGGLDRVLPASRADLAIYLAGADPFAGDTLGRLALTKAGLAERDCLVFERCREAGVPVAVVMGGGYARRIEDTVDIQFETVRIAIDLAPAFASLVGVIVMERLARFFAMLLTMVSASAGYLFVLNRLLIQMRGKRLKSFMIRSGGLLTLAVSGALGWRIGRSRWLLLPAAGFLVASAGEVRRLAERRRRRGSPPVAEHGPALDLRRPATTTDLVVRRYEVPVAGWSGPALRVAHVSDFHLNSHLPMSYFQEAMQRVAETRPTWSSSPATSSPIPSTSR